MDDGANLASSGKSFRVSGRCEIKRGRSNYLWKHAGINTMLTRYSRF